MVIIEVSCFFLDLSTGRVPSQSRAPIGRATPSCAAPITALPQAPVPPSLPADESGCDWAIPFIHPTLPICTSPPTPLRTCTPSPNLYPPLTSWAHDSPSQSSSTVRDFRRPETATVRDFRRPYTFDAGDDGECSTTGDHGSTDQHGSTSPVRHTPLIHDPTPPRTPPKPHPPCESLSYRTSRGHFHVTMQFHHPPPILHGPGVMLRVPFEVCLFRPSPNAFPGSAQRCTRAHTAPPGSCAPIFTPTATRFAHASAQKSPRLKRSQSKSLQPKTTSTLPFHPPHSFDLAVPLPLPRPQNQLLCVQPEEFASSSFFRSHADHRGQRGPRLPPESSVLCSVGGTAFRSVHLPRGRHGRYTEIGHTQLFQRLIRLLWDLENKRSHSCVFLSAKENPLTAPTANAVTASAPTDASVRKTLGRRRRRQGCRPPLPYRSHFKSTFTSLPNKDIFSFPRPVKALPTPPPTRRRYLTPLTRLIPARPTTRTTLAGASPNRRAPPVRVICRRTCCTFPPASVPTPAQASVTATATIAAEALRGHSQARPR